jgi:hypothetical protein
MQNIVISDATLSLINQVFEIEEKQRMIDQKNSIHRNVRNLKELLEDGFYKDFGITYHSPLGEAYNETRTDCDLTENLSDSFEDLVISQVIRPIIRVKQNNTTNIVQRARVVVQSKGFLQENSNAKTLSQSKVRKERQLRDFIKSQLQLSCSNSYAKRIIRVLYKKI